MKIKKNKFFKILGLSMSFVAIPLVSIVTVSCSTPVNEGSNNNGGGNSNQEIIDPSLDSDFKKFFDLLKFSNDDQMVDNVNQLNELLTNLSSSNKHDLATALIKSKYGMSDTKLTDRVFIRVSDNEAKESNITVEKTVTQEKLLSEENVVGVKRISTDKQSLIFDIQITKNENVVDPLVYGYLVSPFPTTHPEKYSVVQKVMSDTITIKLNIGGSKGLYVIDNTYDSKESFLNDIHNYKDELNGVGLVVAAINDGNTKKIAFSSYYDTKTDKGSVHLSSHISYDLGDNCPESSKF